MTKEEWRTDKTVIARANAFLKTNFKVNPYSHQTEFEKYGEHFTLAAQQFFKKQRRCNGCGLKMPRQHLCAQDSALFIQKIKRPLWTE
ncbi:hypothetical protein DAKH74_011960 [Maudiozyma humilis]|uniref:Uncharacterized protein n=1 Tax=Maudiozyma humilis TaxID=51915 RepID=A0AAV5RST3_MAUHU|nr:hypothetical protein DAKH74_011960 [Kazachstania humilis]